MKSKALVVGLTPDYYSTSVSTALKHGRLTMRSTNMGASFITRSILSIFDADYVDFTSVSKLSDLRNTYDTCIVSLASHLGPSRDIGCLVRFLKRLDLRSVFVSGGVDAGAAACIDQKANKSVLDLLEICTADGQWIGVRGALSAFYLHRHGIECVAPIGCPTMYSRPPKQVSAPDPDSELEITIPFHWSIATTAFEHLKSHYLVGQDCTDEELFVKGRKGSVTRKVSKSLGISRREAFRALMEAVRDNGHFPNDYADWYDAIGRQDALLSGRLHAAICGLTQGVPSVLVPWDLRMQELVDYFALPNVSGCMIRKKGVRESFFSAEFEKYNRHQPLYWERWYEFLDQNKLARYCGKEAMGEHGNQKKCVDPLDCGRSLLSTAAVPYYLTNISTSRSFSNTVGSTPRPAKRLVTVLRSFLVKCRMLVTRL